MSARDLVHQVALQVPEEAPACMQVSTNIGVMSRGCPINLHRLLTE
jgi:hypothetical protein